ELADHPNRLLVTATPAADDVGREPDEAEHATEPAPTADETYAEVAHEAIFRRWDKLREWTATERGFLAWRSGLEFARRTWQGTPDRSKADALLRGFALRQAQDWLARRPADVTSADRDFIRESGIRTRWRQIRTYASVGGVAIVLTAWWQAAWLKEQAYWLLHV